MKMTKNRFALALCFATFAAQAHNATYNPNDRTITITVDHNNAVTSMVAIVVTPEEASRMLNPSDDTTMTTPEIIDGMVFTHDEVTYFVRADLTKTINLTINITVNIANTIEEEVIIIDGSTDDSDSDCSYSDSNDSVVSDVTEEAVNEEINIIIADLDNNENATQADDIESDDTTPQL